jgi:hypothetical protein
LFKDEVVDCGGSRGNVVELLDKVESVLTGRVDENEELFDKKLFGLPNV